jgi:hypothetical protein
LIVENPVYTARAITGTYSCTELLFILVLRASIHFVPANNVHYLPSLLGSYSPLDYGGDFITGILSPVSIDSFITHVPDKMTQSHGIIEELCICIKSPNKISSDYLIIPNLI